MGNPEKSLQPLLERYCDEMARSLVARAKEPAIDTWPQPILNPFEGNYIAHEHVISTLGVLVGDLKDIGFTDTQVARLFRTPSRITHLMYQFMEEPTELCPVSIRTAVAECLLSYISILRHGNTFCENGCNLLWSRPDVECALEHLQDANTTSLSLGSFGRQCAVLAISLAGYCELLYFSNMSFGRESHGPYPVSDNETIVVRDFQDLNPTFWTFTESYELPCISIVGLYRDLRVSFDFSGRMNTQCSLPSKLVAVGVQVNGKWTPVQELSSMSSQICDAIQSAKRQISVLGKRQLLQKWIEALYWPMRPLALALQRDLRIPAELANRIKHAELTSWIPQTMKRLASRSEEERLQVLSKIFDPRVTSKRNLA